MDRARGVAATSIPRSRPTETAKGRLRVVSLIARRVLLKRSAKTDHRRRGGTTFNRNLARFPGSYVSIGYLRTPRSCSPRHLATRRRAPGDSGRRFSRLTSRGFRCEKLHEGSHCVSSRLIIVSHQRHTHTRRHDFLRCETRAIRFPPRCSDLIWLLSELFVEVVTAIDRRDAELLGV